MGGGNSLLILRKLKDNEGKFNFFFKYMKYDNKKKQKKQN